MISIHAPHEGERRTQLHAPRGLLVFQSTLPTRGSDGFSSSAGRAARDFNPRSPRGGATRLRMARGRIEAISIHAPHEGERLISFLYPSAQMIFQSTLPTRGSDDVCKGAVGLAAYFNPRSPRGGATTARLRTVKAANYFNPRSPRGGATVSSLAIL